LISQQSKSVAVSDVDRVLVIGAGPAGAAATMRLHDHGINVLWVDRADFPRTKVCGCCLNMAAIGALATVKCDALVKELADGELRWWRLESGGPAVIAPLPGGIALSRTSMDLALINEARRRGIEMRTGCEAKLVDVSRGAVVVKLSDQSSEQSFAAAILATGLSGAGVARWLPWINQPSGPLGVGTVIHDLPGVLAHTIHMVCGEQGYVGLVRLEDGRVDVAAALRKDRFASPVAEITRSGKAEILCQVNAILARTDLGQLPADQIDHLMTTPPLHRARQVGHGRLLAVGDAAGYVEPFTGEGMAWAISTGIAAADCIANGNEHLDLGLQWSQTYATMMRKRQWICRALSSTLASPLRSRWLVRAMRWSPWAVRRAIWQLNSTSNNIYFATMNDLAK